MDTHYPAGWPFRRPRRFHLPGTDACCGCPGCPRGRIVPTYAQACHVLWAVCVMRWTQAHAANAIGLSSGTVSRIVRGLRFPHARPVPMLGRRRGGGCGSPAQGVLPFA